MTHNTETHEFKAETRRLFNLMIHSLYSNKQIFLRELISNASDALDRLRFEALTNPAARGLDHKLEIRLDPDPEARTLAIHDTGIGMSRQEVIENLGTIAHSGWQQLLEVVKARGAEELPPEFIGQFGVGFYSSFMVADRVTVVTRRAGETTATRWVSDGDGTFEVADAEREAHGTSITLQLKPIDVEDGREDFTSEYVLDRIVREYSDFVCYPILLRVFREQVPENEATGSPPSDAPRRTVEEDRTLNSMKALWSRPQTEVKAEEYNEFYRHISHDWDAPAQTILQHAEGRLQYDALLFIPAKAPRELYFQAYQSGLQLYVRNVKIIEQCTDLLPRYLRFVRGIVDCVDLPLNVSREMLQQTREISQIRKALVKKILDTLTELQTTTPESYLAFWQEFGRAMKEGLASDHDNRDKLTRLALFQSSAHPTKLTTLAEYVGRMQPAQSDIFYITGESRVICENQPALESFMERHIEVLYLVEPVDELVLQYLHNYEGKRLKSVGKGTVDLGSDDEKQEAKREREAQEKKYADMFTAMQKRVDEHVKQIRLSSRLTASAACLVGAEHDYSPQLERLLLAGKGGGPKQRRILEINAKHPLLDLIHTHFERDHEAPLVGDFAELLLGQGLLLEGSELPDPVRFSRLIVAVMVRSLQAPSPTESNETAA